MKIVKYMYNVVTSWKFEVCLQFFSVIPKKVILFQRLFCLLSFQSLPVLPVFPRVTHQMRSPYCKENCQYFRLFPRNAMAHYIIMSVFHIYIVLGFVITSSNRETFSRGTISLSNIGQFFFNINYSFIPGRYIVCTMQGSYVGNISPLRNM